MNLLRLHFFKQRIDIAGFRNKMRRSDHPRNQLESHLCLLGILYMDQHIPDMYRSDNVVQILAIYRKTGIACLFKNKP